MLNKHVEKYVETIIKYKSQFVDMCFFISMKECYKYYIISL